DVHSATVSPAPLRSKVDFVRLDRPECSRLTWDSALIGRRSSAPVELLEQPGVRGSKRLTSCAERGRERGRQIEGGPFSGRTRVGFQEIRRYAQRPVLIAHRTGTVVDV